MSTAIQTVASTYAVNTLSVLGAIGQAAQKSNSPLFSPDVISILSGSASATPVTYNAAGLIESVLQVADTASGASGSVTAQALTALLARNFNPSAPNGADALTANQDLARLLAADPNPAVAGMDANAAAARVYDAAGRLLGLPSDSATTAQNNLLSYELGRAAAAGDQGIGASAASGTDAALALKDLLLANAELTVAAQAAATSSIGVTANTRSVAGNTASTAIAPAIAAAAIAATDATAATATNAGAATISTAPTAAASASGSSEAATASAVNFVQDTAAQALANIEANSAYANAVSGLYMSAAIFRAQQAQTIKLNAADSIQPVSAVPKPIDAARESNV